MRSVRKVMAALMLGAILTLGAAVSTSAHQAGPCGESGGPGNSDYAQHHIVPLAQAGMLGAGGHIPGSHQGFSRCNPADK